MAQKKINYLARNFADVRSELFTFIKKYYPEIFSDFSDSSVGTMMIELNAAVADMLSYHTDRMYNETQIEYAQERKSLLSMARTMGIKIPGQRPAVTLVDFQVTVPVFGDSYDTRYTPVLRSNAQVLGGGQVFENLEDIDFNSPFTAGGIPNRTIVPNFNGNGDLVNYTLTKRELVVNGKTTYFSKSISPSDVKPFLQLVLPQTNVLSVDSIITLENPTDGIPNLDVFNNPQFRWYQVDSLAEDKVFVDDNSRTSDNKSITPAKWKNVTQRFITEYTDTGYCKITFGSGTGNETSPIIDIANNYGNLINTTALGEIPKEGNTMYVKYRVGGGTGSNIGPGAITSLGNFSLEVDGPNSTISSRVSKTLRVSNPIPAVGGSNSPSLEEIRNLVKYNFASQNRATTTKDYVAQVLRMPGKYGLPFRWSVEEISNKIVITTIGLNAENKLTNVSSSTLKQNLSTWLADYRMINDYVEITDGKVINLGLDLDIFVDKSFNQSEVVNNVIRSVIEYFDVKKWSMGQDIFVSNLVETINNVGGVLNLVNFKVNNLVGGNYSNNRTNQTTLSFDDQSIPAVYGLDMSDYTIFGQNNGMFEIKNPNRDITVRVKTN
tara:strand:+ start:63023 stop:64843 length:1821 start_codon:yes stop_codon:yes gene_type:complete